MKAYRLTESEMRFAEIVWRSAPLTSGELVRLCERELSWKKSTTYTVLRKLCDKGIFKNDEALVSVLADKDAYHRMQGEQMIEDDFGGSLPKFLTAFMSGRNLSKKQISEIQALIDAHRGE